MAKIQLWATGTFSLLPSPLQTHAVRLPWGWVLCGPRAPSPGSPRNSRKRAAPHSGLGGVPGRNSRARSVLQLWPLHGRTWDRHPGSSSGLRLHSYSCTLPTGFRADTPHSACLKLGRSSLPPTALFLASQRRTVFRAIQARELTAISGSKFSLTPLCPVTKKVLCLFKGNRCLPSLVLSTRRQGSCAQWPRDRHLSSAASHHLSPSTQKRSNLPRMDLGSHSHFEEAFVSCPQLQDKD